MKNLNMMTLDEVLKSINDDTTLLERGRPFGFSSGSPLHKLFSYAYLPQRKFLLPEGDPPYTPSVQTVGMTGADLLVAIRRNRLDYFVDRSIASVRREQLFISLLETVYAAEAKILLAVKDQQLDKLYPNLTYKTLYQYGYLPYDEVRCNESSFSQPPAEPELKSEPAQPVEPTAKRATRTTRSTTKRSSKSTRSRNSNKSTSAGGTTEPTVE